MDGCMKGERREDGWMHEGRAKRDGYGWWG